MVMMLLQITAIQIEYLRLEGRAAREYAAVEISAAAPCLTLPNMERRAK